MNAYQNKDLNSSVRFEINNSDKFYSLSGLEALPKNTISCDHAFSVLYHMKKIDSWKLIIVTSFEINAILRNPDGSLIVLFELIGVTGEFDSCMLDIMCFDENDSVLGNTANIHIVPQGTLFKITDFFTLPKGTSKIKFVSRDYAKSHVL